MQPAGKLLDTSECGAGECKDGSVHAQLLNIQKSLRRYFRSRVGHNDADDLVQDVVVSILSRKTTAPILHFNGYVFGVASNRLRSFHGDRVRLSQSEDDYRQQSETVEELHPERRAISNEAIRALHRAIGLLPVRMRDAFLLSRFTDMAYPEIAAHMGISVSAVEKHLMKSLGRLAKAMEPYL